MSAPYLGGGGDQVFLITTALEETWRDDEPVLFLGEWCRLHGRKDCWSGMNAEVLPYHWDDREKLYADYQYLQDFHERLLSSLTEQLNQISGEDHSLRYWRILIGPWLGYFTQMLFDRWSSIQQAVDRHELTGTIVLTGQEDKLVPNDMASFARLYTGDQWNHQLYADILKRFTEVSCTERARAVAGVDSTERAALAWKRRLKRTLAGWHARAASHLTKDQDAFFLATYLPFRDEMQMHRRFGQTPQLWRSVSPASASVDWTRRQWRVSGDSRSAFEECARVLIPLNLPTAYLEGYGKLIAQTAELPWPRKPKLIWTSVSENSDDVFKAWAAGKVEQGTPLIIGQHGGHYGTGRWAFVEDHAIAVSDRYLSWGWTEEGKSKVEPLGQLKAKRPLGVRHAIQPHALLVTVALPRYSYWMYSIMVARQWLDYCEDQYAFVEGLPESIQDALIVRQYPEEYGWEQAARWHERFPTLRLDDGRSDITGLIRQSRLYISTYNATTYLESFTMNVPTVIYWNPKHSELRETAIPYFDELKRVGIFHDSPLSAARHVAAVWDDIDAWWGDPSVQKVLDRFKARYCNLPDDLVDRVEVALRSTLACSGTVRNDVADNDKIQPRQLA